MELDSFKVVLIRKVIEAKTRKDFKDVIYLIASNLESWKVKPDEDLQKVIKR